MKQKYFRILFFMIISFYALTLNLYPQDSLLIDTNNYRLFFMGESQSISELKNKFIAGYTFVNIPIDPTFYKQEYPNPFSPSTVKEKFLYRLEDSSDVTMVIIDHKDSVIFNLMLKEQGIGYYYFIIRSNYFVHSSTDQKVLSSIEDIKIVFLIEDEKFSFPLRNIDHK